MSAIAEAHKDACIRAEAASQLANDLWSLYFPLPISDPLRAGLKAAWERANLIATERHATCDRLFRQSIQGGY